jgi:flagellar hook-associated protein 3 FlgL
MISVLNSQYQQFVDDLNQVSTTLSNAQLEVSTGLKMRNVSDAPDQVSELLQARANLSSSQQISTNLVNVKSEVDTGEQSIGSAVTLFDQVQTIAAEGATGTQTAASRAGLAQNLQSILQQMVGLANTNIGGRYIFSGDADQTQPYTYDSTQTPPVGVYQGSSSTRMVQNANGTTFPVALTAQQVFDSSDPSTNVFAAINGLITSLNNNDQTGTATIEAGLSGTASYMNQQLSFYGTAQDTVAAATDYAQNQQTELQTQISNLQDADVTSAIMTMTQAQTQEQAALASEGQLPRQTLFSFLG